MGRGKGFMDPKLKALVAQYMENNPRPHVDLEDAVEYISTCRGFERKNKHALKIIVSRAINQLKTQNNWSQKNRESSSDSSDEELSNVKLMQVEDHNMMNSAITSSYKGSKTIPVDTTTAPTSPSTLINTTVISTPSTPTTESMATVDMKASNGDAKPAKKRKTLQDDESKKKRKLSTTITSKTTFEPQPIPTTSFEDFGGIDHILKEVRKLSEWPMLYKSVFTELGADSPKGVLLIGPPGCGKTMLANAIAGEVGRKVKARLGLDLNYYRIAAPELVSGMSGESESNIRELFATAMRMEPSVIFIDEIDVICGKRDSAQKEMERRIVAQLLTCFGELASHNSRVIVMGATNRADALDPSLRRSGRFDKEISIGVPDTDARAKILAVLTRKLKVQGNFDFKKIAQITPGYVGADLAALCSEAAFIAVEKSIATIEKTTNTIAQEEFSTLNNDVPTDILSSLYITMSDFEVAVTKVQPSAKREGFATIPNVNWDDVGALHDIRKELHNNIIAPIKYPSKFKKVGLEAPNGILLYGPPGCGKTLLAKAIANDCSASFISVKGPELLNKYVGESERAVRQVFERAKMSAPCIIFFDEMDALTPKRDDENSATSRVVNALLAEMDGLEGRKGVFLLAATNRPDIIDVAIMRPGRLDKLLFVPLPNEEARFQILQTLTRKRTLDKDVDLRKIASECENFSGADLNALVKEASLYALCKHMEEHPDDPAEPDEESDDETIAITGNDFKNARTKVSPSVSKHYESQYLKTVAKVSRGL